MAPLDGLDNKASCCQSEVLSHISTFDYARGPSMTGRRGLWGFRYDTTHPKINHYKMHFRFLSAKWNAATRYSARPFTTKTGARVHFFCLNSPRNRGWYQARVHPFSSGNLYSPNMLYRVCWLCQGFWVPTAPVGHPPDKKNVTSIKLGCTVPTMFAG